MAVLRTAVGSSFDDTAVGVDLTLSEGGGKIAGKVFRDLAVTLKIPKEKHGRFHIHVTYTRRFTSTDMHCSKINVVHHQNPVCHSY